MPTNVTEQALWAVLNHLSWWYWAPVCLMAAWCLWGVYGLAPVQSKLGRWIRMSLYLGLLLMTGGLFNTAFVSLGLPFVLLGLRGWLWQTRQECLRTGKIKSPQGSFGSRVAATLVVPPR